MRELIRDFLGRPARDDLQPYLQALDCTDLMELAGMYAEARSNGETKLMQAINSRMETVARQQGLLEPTSPAQAGRTEDRA